MANDQINIEDSDDISKEDMSLICNSRLFFNEGDLDNNLKLKIFNWYKNLSEDDRECVDILIDEARQHTEYWVTR